MIWVYAVILVIWGNVVNALIHPMLPGGDWSAVMWGGSLAVISLAFARLLNERRSMLGIARGDWRGIAIGGALGLGGALAGALVLRTGPIVGPVQWNPVLTTTPEEIAAHMAFFLPLSVAIPEELAFRGILLGGIWARRGRRIAIAGSAITFALWHAWIIYYTLLQTNLANGPLMLFAGLAGMAFVAVGGVVLALLRVRSGGLVAPILAHWAFDGFMLLGLWI